MTMTKTVKDYMNDPRILNDRGVMEAPRCIREIHAIRLKIQDETVGMTPAERTEYYNKRSAAFLLHSKAN
jgi:hypothetical protein